MHGMNDEVDMRRYGGLRKLMPVTFVTFLFGYLAIIGIPPFSGFFTKDKIIEAAFDKGGVQGWTFGFIALLGAGITAFYMTRMVIMTFFGEKRWDDGRAPARVADGHDRPAGRAGLHVARQRCAAHARRPVRRRSSSRCSARSR